LPELSVELPIFTVISWIIPAFLFCELSFLHDNKQMKNMKRKTGNILYFIAKR
jgi:hypothetical protein